MPFIDIFVKIKCNFYLLGIPQRKLHDSILVPHIVGDHLHRVCCPHKEDSRSIQWVQVHRILNVHNLCHLACVYSHLLQHRPTCGPQDHINVCHDQVPKPPKIICSFFSAKKEIKIVKAVKVKLENDHRYIVKRILMFTFSYFLKVYFCPAT